MQAGLGPDQVTHVNRLEPRSGPTYVGPDLVPSLFAFETLVFEIYSKKLTVFKMLQTKFECVHVVSQHASA